MFKKRKGFRYIELDDGKFQFNWCLNGLLVMYAEDGTRIDIPDDVWGKIKTSNEYALGRRFYFCGKREVREAYRKYKVLQANKL